MIKAIFGFLWEAFKAYNSASAAHNSPEMVKAAVKQSIEDHREALSNVNKTLKDQGASAQDHANALDKLRITQS